MSLPTKSKEIAGGKAEITVTQFPSLTAYEVFADGTDPAKRASTAYLRRLLSYSFLVRIDEDGQKQKHELATDAQINAAFSGLGFKALIDAREFAVEVNFGDFLDAAKQ